MNFAWRTTRSTSPKGNTAPTGNDQPASPGSRAGKSGFGDEAKSPFSGLPKRTPFRKSEHTRDGEYVAEQFRRATSDAEKAKLMADLVAKAADLPLEERKKLIPDNRVMAQVLDEMLRGVVSPGKEREHAAVRFHLNQQLALRPSEVPGIKLTGFSHIREFETVMPKEFNPVSLKQVEDQIIRDSMENARKPKNPVPCNVFTVEQFIGRDPPRKNPEIKDPKLDGAIHGRDFAGNKVVGIRQLHEGMDDIWEMMEQAHYPVLPVSEGVEEEDDWEKTAWMAAMMQIPALTLGEKLRAEAKKQEKLKELEGQIAAIVEAAKLFQSLVRNAAGVAKNIEEQTGKPTDAEDVAITAFRKLKSNLFKDIRNLTSLFIGSKKSFDGSPLLNSKPGNGMPHIASLLSSLGVPCITMRHDVYPDKAPSNLMFHAPDMSDCDEAFGAKNREMEKAVLAKASKSVPVVVIHAKGLGLRMPHELPFGPEEVPEADGTKSPEQQ